MLELMLNTFGGQMSVFINTQAGCYFYRSAFFFFLFFFCLLTGRTSSGEGFEIIY